MCARISIALCLSLVVASGSGLFAQGRTQRIPTSLAAATKFDRYGDPLPAEATTRLGTQRFRCADGFQSVAYTPDGRHLVTGGWGGARLWDAKTGQFVRTFGAEMTQAYGPAGLSSDGKLVAVGGWDQQLGGGAVYEIASGKRLYRFGSPSMNAQGCFSPDGKNLAYFPRNDGAVVVLDAATGKERQNLKAFQYGKNEGMFSVHAAFLPDSKTLVSGAGDGTIRVWDVRYEKELRRIDAAADGVADLAVSPDGTLIAAIAWKIIDHGNGQRTFQQRAQVDLWDTRTGKRKGAIEARSAKRSKNEDENGPSFFAFAPNSRELVTGDTQGALRIWDIATGKELRHFTDQASYLLDVGFGPKNTIAVIENHSLRLRDYTTGRDLAPTVGHRGPIVLALPSPDGSIVATGDREERAIVLWNAKTGAESHRLTGGTEAFRSMLFSADGKNLFAMDYHGWFWDWEIATGKEVRRVKQAKQSADLKQSLDGKTLALGNSKGVTLVSASNGQEIRTLRGDGARLEGFDFTPDGRSIVGWASDGRLHRWDIATGKRESRHFYQLESNPFSVVFSPDGRLVTFGVQNSDFLPVVDLATGGEVCRFDLTPDEPSQSLIWVAFSPDSRTLAWGGRKEGSVWLGELATGNVRHQLVGHRGRVQALAWMHGGKNLLSASADTTALIWNLTGPLPGDRLRAPLTEDQLTTCWDELRGNDAKRAYAALRRLAADPQRTVPFLQKHLHPVAAAEERQLAKWVGQLGSANFADREQADRELKTLGESALSALQKRLDQKPSLEETRRIERLLQQIRVVTPDRVRTIRAVETLEAIGSDESKELLQRLASGVPEALATREAKGSLLRLSSGSSR